MNRTLSPVQVAERCKTSRSAVMRALYGGALPSKKDNRQRWRIKPEDADAWFEQRSDTAAALAEHRPETVRSDTLQMVHLELAAAKAEAEGLRARLADTQAERDRLAHLLDEALKARPTGILARIFGR